MKFNEIIKDVRSFCLKEGEELIVNTKRDLLKNRIKVASKVDDVNYNVISGDLVFNSNESVFINDSKLSGKEYFKCDIESRIILLGSDFEIDYPSYIGTYYLFDVEKKSIVFNKLLRDSYLSFKTNSKFSYTDKKRIYMLSITSNGSELWQFDLSQFGQWKETTQDIYDYKVDQFVGIYENVLYVLLSNSKLIGIDAIQGTLVCEINLGEHFALETRDWLTSGCKMHLDEERGRIIWLTSATLIQIELSTFKARLIKSFFTEDYHFIWRFLNVTFFDELLYFTGQYGRESGYPDIVGTMHPDTGEILWQYKIDGAESLNEPPQVNSTHLYVRDINTEILYIFERE